MHFGSALNIKRSSCFSRWPKQSSSDLHLGRFPRLALLTCWVILLWLVNLSRNNLGRMWRGSRGGRHGGRITREDGCYRAKHENHIRTLWHVNNILAQFTSVSLTSLSLTPSFSHLLHNLSPQKKAFAHMCQTQRRQALQNVCVYLTDLHYNLFYKMRTVWVGSGTEDGLDHVLLIAMFCFHKSKQYMDTYRSHAGRVFMKRGLRAGSGSQHESIATLM